MLDSANRHTQVLAGIGLVLVGLLSGILLMLVLGDAPAEPRVTQIVKRVEGASQPGTTSTARTTLDRAAEEPAPVALNRLFRGVARDVRAAVVSVHVARERGGSGGMGPGRNPFGAPQQNLGSGVLISPDGHIVTNSHVVEEAGAIRVQLADKRQFDARVVGTDPSTDLAVIKVDGEREFPILPLGNSDQLEVGDWVVAVGNPFQLTSTVTAGIVSALGRQINVIRDELGIENFIQTDAAINPGNSGGALVNLEGELVGINTAIASTSRSSEGYGFAIPSTLVERVATDLIAYGEVRRGYLGVSIMPVTAEVADTVGLETIRGVYIDGVRQGSAADQAGIEAGDVVLTVMGETVNSPSRLQSLVVRQRPGDQVPLGVWRDGMEHTYDVRLMGEDSPVYQEWLSDLRSTSGPSFSPDGETPSPDDLPGSEERPEADEPPILELDEWGMGLRSIPSSEASEFGVEEGAYVAYVESGGRAAAAGLPRDVVITHLDDVRVEDPSDVVDYFQEASGPILVQVQRRNGTPAFYEVGP